MILVIMNAFTKKNNFIFSSAEHQKADWVGIHEKICEKLAFLRQPTPFMPSKEEREKRQMQVKLMKVIK